MGMHEGKLMSISRHPLHEHLQTVMSCFYRHMCLQMVVPLLRTLVKLHELHILHRDIKPENIFLTSDQTFKLGDFGLAIQSNIELPFTRSGTLDYLSPEV